MTDLNVAVLRRRLKEVLLRWKLASERVGAVVDQMLHHFCTSEFSGCDKWHQRRFCIFLRSVCVKT